MVGMVPPPGAGLRGLGEERTGDAEDAAGDEEEAGDEIRAGALLGECHYHGGGFGDPIWRTSRWSRGGDMRSAERGKVCGNHSKFLRERVTVCCRTEKTI